MDIVIHGTRGGLTIFTPKKLPGLLEVTADSAQASAIGKEAYAIRFTADNAIFSKYRIIRDVRGDKRTGFVGFSLFLPKDEKLSGADIISLLDKVSDDYCRLHAPDNNLDDTVEENWDLLDAVLNRYESKPKYDEEMQSGSKDDAFVYFKDADGLKCYFDAPVQEEYSDYRQILFVKEELRNKPENPLNALRHSKNDLTGQIDLENKYYYLTDYNSSKGVSICVWKDETWQLRSDKKYHNCIRAKEQVVIQYSKDERCYWPIKAEGRLSDRDSEIYEYLKIKDNEIFINSDAFNPTPKEQTVHFEIKDHKGTPLSDVEIQIGTQPWNMTSIDQCRHTFSGEELKSCWSVSAKKGDDLSEEVSFTLEEDTSTIPLTLHERKSVKFQVVDEEGRPVHDYRIQIEDKEEIPIEDNGDLVFNDEAIYTSWEITITHYKYENETFTYCPATDGDPKPVTLKNRDFGHRNPGRDDRKKEIYGLKIDEKCWKRVGDIESIKAGVSDSSDLPDVNPRWGYKFAGWSELHKGQWKRYGIPYDGYYEACFKELWYRKIPKWSWMVGGIAIIALAVAIVFTVKYCRTDNTEHPFDESEIQSYVEGDSIFLHKLNRYQTNWENQKPEIKKEGGSWLSAFGIGSKEEKRDSTDYKKWEEVLQSIYDAITLRQRVNESNFAKLKNSRYSPRQQKFKEAIEKIEPASYEAVREQLGDVSKLTLNQIADSIHAIVKEMEEAQLKEQEVENEAEQDNKPAEEKPQEKKESATRPPEETATTPVQQSTSTNDITTKIINYLKSGELKKSGLEAYRPQAPNPNLKNSIDLALKFWELDGSTPNNSYSSYQKELANDNILNDSGLKRVVDSMCKKDKPKYVKDLLEIEQNQNLNSIKKKLQ